jgi:CRP-like cAMP-binding protein
MAIPLEISETQLLEFKKQIRLLAPVPDDDLDKLVSLLHVKNYSKDEFILKAGSVCKNFYFILTGLVRGYEIFNDKEVNVEFFFENHIAADFYSLRNETPSQQFLVTMEPCEILYAAREDYLKVFLQSAPLTFMSMRLFQNMFFEEEAYSTMFKKLTSEERYQYVLENRPNLIQRIPINQLASYLGMSRESLSRIRSRINR